MAGILSGLARFGLGKLENMELYEAPKKEDGGQEGKPAPAVVQEQDFLFDKSCTCPICDKEFKNRTVKVGKAKLSGSDLDLRPRYEQIDLLKYDIIMCPYCGYAALSRFFKFVTSPQAKNIKKTISATFEPQKETKEVYTYDEALERYKLALANAIVKQTKASEKKTVENILATPGSASLPFASAVNRPLLCRMLKTSEAATKPMMNFGNFSHTMPSDGA